MKLRVTHRHTALSGGDSISRFLLQLAIFDK